MAAPNPITLPSLSSDDFKIVGPNGKTIRTTNQNQPITPVPNTTDQPTKRTSNTNYEQAAKRALTTTQITRTARIKTTLAHFGYTDVHNRFDILSSLPDSQMYVSGPSTITLTKKPTPRTSTQTAAQPSSSVRLVRAPPPLVLHQRPDSHRQLISGISAVISANNFHLKYTPNCTKTLHNTYEQTPSISSVHNIIIIDYIDESMDVRPGDPLNYISDQKAAAVNEDMQHSDSESTLINNTFEDSFPKPVETVTRTKRKKTRNTSIDWLEELAKEMTAESELRRITDNNIANGMHSLATSVQSMSESIQSMAQAVTALANSIIQINNK